MPSSHHTILELSADRHLIFKTRETTHQPTNRRYNGFDHTLCGVQPHGKSTSHTNRLLSLTFSFQTENPAKTHYIIREFRVNKHSKFYGSILPDQIVAFIPKERNKQPIHVICIGNRPSWRISIRIGRTKPDWSIPTDDEYKYSLLNVMGSQSESKVREMYTEGRQKTNQLAREHQTVLQMLETFLYCFFSLLSIFQNLLSSLRPYLFALNSNLVLRGLMSFPI